MKKVSILVFLSFFLFGVYAQSSTTYGRVYTMLNAKCQNQSCHSATSSGDGPKFDGDSDQVYQGIFNVPSQLWPASVNNHEEVVFPEQPYQSLLLKKIATAANFDTDLSLDSTGEGNGMVDINGDTLSKIEIEWVRQWIRYGAKETYFAGNSTNAPDAQPDYAAVYSFYTDTIQLSFLPKPPKPAAGTGLQFRMGPCFMAPWEANNQEFVEQQIAYFPYAPEIYKLEGFMNEQSHHFILFQYLDSISARSTSSNINNGESIDIADVGQISPQTLNFLSPFTGNKNIVATWVYTNTLDLPAGTGIMWPQKTYMDMDYHTLGYNITSVLPCDFYFNIYYRPRNPSTIPMIADVENNGGLGLSSQYPPLTEKINGVSTGNHDYLYDDSNNGNAPEIRYLWAAAGHTHKFGTSFYIQVRDTMGNLADTIYDGGWDYNNNIPSTWDYRHPPLEYWPNLLPVQFGMHNGKTSGLVANTNWYVYDTLFVTFSFTENGEMQLFYYMYTQQPLNGATSINEPEKPIIYFEIMPNPVSSTGKLVYTLTAPAQVQASVLDITGKEVAALAQVNEDVGVHNIAIGDGQKLSSGLYFARLIINGTVYTKKFIVME